MNQQLRGRLADLERHAAPGSYERGYQDGLRNRSYLPWLDYQTSGEWLAWLDGWRAGQAALARTRAAESSAAVMAASAPPIPRKPAARADGGQERCTAALSQKGGR